MRANPSAWVVNVEEADFQREVIERSREVPVVVDFWAPWCGPCRMLGPMLEQAVRERQGEVVLAKVNVDTAPRLAAEFQVSSIPLVIAFRDGRPVLDFLGVLPEHDLRRFLDAIGPTEADRFARKAKELEATRPAEAEEMYRKALAADRLDEAAAIGLVRLLVAQGKDDEASAILGQVGFTGANEEEASRLNGILFVRRLAATFGDEASARQRLEVDPNNGRLLYELGCIVAAAGRYQEALDLLVSAAERDTTLAAVKVREVMVNIFNIIGVRSPLADEYRDRLTAILY